MAQHRVEDEQELVHGGGESDLLGFSGGEQPLVEWPEDGIVPHGYQAAHIQSGSYAGAAAPDDAPPTQDAAFAVERRHPNERGDLLAIERAQLR